MDRIRNNCIHDKQLSRLFQHQIPLYIRSKQAMGRLIRGKADIGALIILDHRADDFLDRHLWLSRYSHLEELTDDVTHFFHSNK